MAKEVKARVTKEDLKAEVERLRAKNNEIMAAYNEIAFQKKPEIIESGEYKALEKQLTEERIKAKEAERLYKSEVEKRERLRQEYLKLKEHCDTILTSYNALRSDFEALSIQLAERKETLKNARGAGRKAALSKEVQEEVRDMHKLGMSYREIAQKIGVSFSVVARACQSSKNDNKN